jgi:RNA polymerase sigma-B factor
VITELGTMDSATAQDQLVESHLGLAKSLARRFVNRGESYEDLVQVASLALVKAVQRFDPDRGVAFSTFATVTVVGELKRHLRDKCWSVRAPRRLQQLVSDLAKTTEELSHELGRSPTINELAIACSVDESDVLEAMEAGRNYRSTSLEALTVKDPDGSSMSVELGDDDEELSLAEDRVSLSPHLRRLPPRQQQVVALRFVEGLTQSEIARRIGVSQMQVSRLLSAALTSLREAYGVEDGSPPE